MLCKVCGAQIPDDSTKCEFCGATMENGEITEDTIDETKVIDTEEIKEIEEQEAVKDDKDEIFDDNERRRREQMQRMMENKKKQLSEIERRRNEKRVKQKRNRIALIALICALAVAAAGYGTYYLLQNINTENNIAETPAPSATVALVTPTPSVEPTPTQSPALNMTPAPNNNSGATAQNGQSWSATGNSTSGGSSASGNSSGSSGSSSSGANSSGGGTSSASNPSGGSSSSTGSSGSISSVVANAKASGISNANIASQLSVGGEVIYNTGTGRYLMTFVTGNVRYYANVSAGSTTEQIQYKPYTITAAPTSETYNGNTVYEISSMTNYAGNDYVLENSGTRLLTDSDIRGMSRHDLALARNEIYARHGRKFQTAEYRNFFTSKSWYKVNPNYNYSDDNSNLNSIEIKNVQFLLNAERR